MEIIKIYTENNEIVAVLMKDAKSDFPIKVTSLHNPIIFDELEKSGWLFTGMPYGFEKASVTLESLPSAPWNPAEFEEVILQDMEDYDIELMEQSELVKRMKPVTKKAKEVFKKGSYIITTCEEFLDFLHSISRNSKNEQDDATLYTPINSFVHPNALFTVEEYFQDTNSKYRQILERRRKFAFLHFYQLQNQMIELGLKSNFTAFELVDFYFSWGICGINMLVTNSDLVKEFVPLMDVNRMAGDVKFLQYTTGYVDGLGQCKSDRQEKVKSTRGEAFIDNVMKYLNEPGMETKDIFPAEVNYPSSENRRVIVGQDLYVAYSASTVKITYKEKSLSMSTFVVYNPVDKKRLLNYKYWNLQDKNSFLEEMRTRLICTELISRVSVKSDATSIGVLSYLGVSYVNAFRYILNRLNLMEVLKEELEDESLATVNPVYLVERYLQGSLDENNELYSAISEFVMSVLDGTVNVDNIDEGILIDSAEDENLYHMVTAARKYLGLSWEQIEKAVGDISLENNTLTMEGNDLRIKYTLNFRDAHKRAKALDINKYVTARASSALFVTRAKYVLRESVPDGYKPRHVAVVMDVIPIQNRKGGNVHSASLVNDKRMEDIIKRYTKAMQNLIQEKAPKDAYKYVGYAETWVTQGLFELAEMAKLTTFSKYCDGAVLDVDFDDANYVQARIFQQVESLFTLTDNVLDPNGKFCLVNVNGTFTPNFFVPFEGVTVPTLPFLMSYKNTAYFSAEQRDTLLKRGWIPTPYHNGFSYLYKQNRLVSDYRVLPTLETEPTTGNLDSYEKLLENNLTLYKENPIGNLSMPEDPIFTVYPALEELMESDEICIEEEMSKDTAYCQGANYTITREEVLERSTFARRVFGSADNVIEDKASIVRGVKYAYSDISAMESIDSTLLLFSFDPSLVRIAFVKNKTEIIFMDGKTIKVSEVSSLDKTQYACEKVSENMYILVDAYGVRYTARI